MAPCRRCGLALPLCSSLNAGMKRVQLPFAASCGVRALAALLQPSEPSELLLADPRLALMHASCLLEIRDAPLLFSKISRPFLIAWMSAPFVPSSDVLAPLQAFYASPLRIFRVGHWLSSGWSLASRGLLQGCPLSPLLSLLVGTAWSLFTSGARDTEGFLCFGNSRCMTCSWQ